jgi:hypothetical protein
MKKNLLFTLSLFFAASTFAQTNTDSLAYQLQRKKINSMLDMRHQKFGEYDQSLARHTGIFGFQTKKDIRRSNDILMDIVKTDNDIFQQLKILLDYRTFQQTQVQTHSNQTDSTNIGFMNEINKLRQENEKLKHDAVVADQERQKRTQTAMYIIIGLLVVVLLLLRRVFVKKNPPIP